jgi:SAM-dependent methyltransferase
MNRPGDPIPPGWDAAAYAAGSSLQTREGLALMERVPERVSAPAGRGAGRVAARLLDLGCGDGRVTEALARVRGFDVVGLDPSPEMVRAARARGLDVVQASAAAPPLADASFDVVFSNAALHWVDDHAAVVRHVARLLRPGGRLIARLGGAGNQAEVVVAAFQLLAEPPYAPHRPADMRSPWNMGDPGEWAVELVRNGMTIHDLRLVTTPGDWASVAEMRRWFVPIASGFTRILPAELRASFVDELLALVWERIDHDRAFVRLVVDAERSG